MQGALTVASSLYPGSDSGCSYKQESAAAYLWLSAVMSMLSFWAPCLLYAVVSPCFALDSCPHGGQWSKWSWAGNAILVLSAITHYQGDPCRSLTTALSMNWQHKACLSLMSIFHTAASTHCSKCYALKKQLTRSDRAKLFGYIRVHTGAFGAQEIGNASVLGMELENLFIRCISSRSFDSLRHSCLWIPIHDKIEHLCGSVLLNSLKMMIICSWNLNISPVLCKEKNK